MSKNHGYDIFGLLQNWRPNLLQIRRVLMLLSVLATIVVNGLASGLSLNGKTTGKISDSFDETRL
jgi:hypothetical protein